MVVNKNIQILIKRFHENNLAHAFLIESNNFDKCLKDILELTKVVCCPKIHKDACEEECNICHLIDQNTFPSITIIDSNDANIEKSKINEMMKKFQAKSIYSEYNVYIIKGAERLNISSANTMLKFIEEPDGQAIGFFITDNSEKLIATIKSRCQRITAMYDEDSIIESLRVSEEDFEKYLNILKNYVKLLETDPDMCFVKNKEQVLTQISTRVEFELFFRILLNIYEKILNKINVEEYKCFEIITNNSDIQLIKKIKIISSILNDLQYNPNLELTLDRLVIEMRELHG